MRQGCPPRSSSKVCRPRCAPPAVSSHPQSGTRTIPDEIAELAERMVVPAGQLECKWPEGEFTATVHEWIQQPPALSSKSGSLGFTVEFPYGHGLLSFCEVKGSEQHPLHGSGLLVAQSFPIAVDSNHDGIRRAFEHDDLELTKIPSCCGFGGYCFLKDALGFSCFVPNILYQPGLLINIYATCAARARAVSLHFAKKDWEDESFSPKRCALGCFLSHLRFRWCVPFQAIDQGGGDGEARAGRTKKVRAFSGIRQAVMRPGKSGITRELNSWVESSDSPGVGSAAQGGLGERQRCGRSATGFLQGSWCPRSERVQPCRRIQGHCARRG